MDLIFFKISLVLYLVAALGYLAFLLVRSAHRPLIGFWAALLGFVFHTLSILHRAIFSGFFPLATAFDALSFFSWLIIGLFLGMRYRDPSPIFGSIATPMACVLMLYGSTMSYQIAQPIVPVLRSWWLPVHVILALFGNGIFALTAIAGLMYLVQERLIKTKRIGRFHRLLPSLESLDAMNRQGLPMGFFLLTLGIISGALWAGSAWGSYWTWDPKETWSLVTWFAYAAMIHQRLALGWRGRRSAALAIFGFVLVMFTFVGVSTLLPGHHAFHAMESLTGGAPTVSGTILVIGLNHATAPVAIREKITFPGDQEGGVSRRLLQVEGVEEAMILSTCNRAEIITVAGDPDTVSETLIREIGIIHELDTEPIRKFLYIKEGPEAVRHVFRVASSLDSMVLGEPQILGQVKEGFRRAASVNATGPIINRLMHRAFFAAKRVRSETEIGMAAVSVAYVAVELARKILGELADKTVLLIGAGEMAELAARHLATHVGKPILVVNRTFENACHLARRLQGSAAPMDQLDEGLIGADVVITSTGSCDPIITFSQMKAVMKKRRYRPIFLIDIAIPRDVEPAVNDLDGIYVYNIDDLQAVVDENLGGRKQEALRGEQIVEDEVEKFSNWARTLESTPTIVALKQRLEAIREGELARLNGKLSHMGPAEREVVEMITRSIINKIAHEPITFLKKVGRTSKRNVYLYAAQRMFKLDGLEENANSMDSEEEES